MNPLTLYPCDVCRRGYLLLVRLRDGRQVCPRDWLSMGCPEPLPVARAKALQEPA